MASKVDELLNVYEKVLAEPWTGMLSGQEKVWFLVYHPSEERKIRLRTPDFEAATIRAKKRWVELSVEEFFPKWMMSQDYKDAYFEQPELLVDILDPDFKDFVISEVQNRLAEHKPDENTVVVLTRVSALFGFLRLSELVKAISTHVNGRFMVFFPGEFDKNQYRLLDARDGWNYLARPIL